MKKTWIKLLSMLLVVLTTFSTVKPDTAFAYSLENLEESVENADRFKNQDGKINRIDFAEKSVDKRFMYVDTEMIYFDENYKEHQIHARQYDKKKNIDLTEKDAIFTVIDDRICTVDENGLVKAGELTGATAVILEDKEGFQAITVVNQTGKCEPWYEDMYKNIRMVSNYIEKKWLKTKKGAYDVCSQSASGYKLITDAYLEYGEKIRTDHETRKNLLKDICVLISRINRNKTPEGKEFGNCVNRAAGVGVILEVLTGYSNGYKFGYDVTDANPNHLTLTVLMDGIVYNVDNTTITEIAKESDWKWESYKNFEGKKCYMLKGTYHRFGNPKIEAIIYTEKGGYGPNYDYELIMRMIAPMELKKTKSKK